MSSVLSPYRYRLAAFLMIGALIAGGCSPPAGNNDNDGPAGNTADNDNSGTVAPGEAGEFVYVLQPDAIELVNLASMPVEWLVLEPSRDGTAGGEFSRSEIETIRTGNPEAGSKRILAYLSIGEAEDYRDYWDPSWVASEGGPPGDAAPSWLGPANPDFGGNYKVRYWDEAWQAIILGTAAGPGATPLDRIIDAGFDGVYLDIIDAYEFWSNAESGHELTRATARERMILWIEQIADYARDERGVTDFLVFPQNGADIIRDDDYEFDPLTEAYFAAIDGIGVEDLFYDELSPQPSDDVTYRLEQLGEFPPRGLTVLVTDYVIADPAQPEASAARAEDFVERATQRGFLPYPAAADRDLDEIVDVRLSSSQP